ncbi:MAG: hypothetical protein LBQ88_10505 [Treponema sp.]|nr:hypothetical protein [Treponema sp.]
MKTRINTGRQLAAIILVFFAATARLWCGGKGEAPLRRNRPRPKADRRFHRPRDRGRPLCAGDR